MAAALRILDEDETTVITTKNLGSINTPGSSSEVQLFVDNFGDQTAEDVTVTITAVGTNDGDDYAQIALDSGGSPGTWGTSDLSLGDIAASSDSPFWVRVILPTGLTADQNPRRFEIDAEGFTV